MRIIDARMNKLRLSVLGLSYSQTQAGAYALILSVDHSDHRIPIIIGSFEAQSIAIQLEDIITARPLTHDLFMRFSQRFEINLKEVIIYKLEEGVFYSRLIFIRDSKTEVIESRTSDAVALALRFKCPIYATLDIVEKAGVVLKIKEQEESKKTDKKASSKKPVKKVKQKEKDVNDLSIAELKKKMDNAIKQEDYEKAAKLQGLINKKKNEK